MGGQAKEKQSSDVRIVQNRHFTKDKVCVSLHILISIDTRVKYQSGVVSGSILSSGSSSVQGFSGF